VSRAYTHKDGVHNLISYFEFISLGLECWQTMPTFRTTNDC